MIFLDDEYPFSSYHLISSWMNIFVALIINISIFKALFS